MASLLTGLIPVGLDLISKLSGTQLGLAQQIKSGKGLPRIAQGIGKLAGTVISMIGNADNEEVDETGATFATKYALPANAVMRGINAGDSIPEDKGSWMRMNKLSARKRSESTQTTLDRLIGEVQAILSTMPDGQEKDAIIYAMVARFGSQSGLLYDMCRGMYDDVRGPSSLAPRKAIKLNLLQTRYKGKLAELFAALDTEPEMDACKMGITDLEPIHFVCVVGGLRVQTPLIFTATVGSSIWPTPDLVQNLSADNVFVKPNAFEVPASYGQTGSGAGTNWAAGATYNGTAPLIGQTPSAAAIAINDLEVAFIRNLASQANAGRILAPIEFTGAIQTTGAITGLPAANFSAGDVGTRLAAIGSWRMEQPDGTFLEKQYGGIRVILPQNSIPSSEFADLTFRWEGSSRVYQPVQTALAGLLGMFNPAVNLFKDISSYLVAIQFDQYEMADVAKILERQELHRGQILGVWPLTYRVEDMLWATNSQQVIWQNRPTAVYRADFNVSFTTPTSKAVILVEMLDVTQQTFLHATGGPIVYQPASTFFPVFTPPESWVRGQATDLAAPAPTDIAPLYTYKHLNAHMGTKGKWTAQVTARLDMPDGARLVGQRRTLVKVQTALGEVEQEQLITEEVRGAMKDNFGKYVVQRAGFIKTGARRLLRAEGQVNTLQHWVASIVDDKAAAYSKFLEFFNKYAEQNGGDKVTATIVEFMLDDNAFGRKDKDGTLSKQQLLKEMREANEDNDFWLSLV